jgi:hypothetical protein
MSTGQMAGFYPVLVNVEYAGLQDNVVAKLFEQLPVCNENDIIVLNRASLVSAGGKKDDKSKGKPAAPGGKDAKGTEEAEVFVLTEEHVQILKERVEVECANRVQVCTVLFHTKFNAYQFVDVYLR